MLSIWQLTWVQISHKSSQTIISVHSRKLSFQLAQSSCQRKAALMFATCQHIVIHSINKLFLINHLPVIHEHIYGKTLNGSAQLYSPKQFEVVGSGSHSYVNQWLCVFFGTEERRIWVGLYSWKRSQWRPLWKPTHQEWSELSEENDTSKLAFPQPHMAAVQMRDRRRCSGTANPEQLGRTV